MKYLLNFNLFENKELDNFKSIASIYRNAIDFRNRDIENYRLAKHLGYINTLFPRKKIKWTEDLVREEAKEFKTRSEFGKKSFGAYVAARGYGILDELFPL